MKKLCWIFLHLVDEGTCTIIEFYRTFLMNDEKYTVGDYILIANHQYGDENIDSKDTAFAAQIKDVIEKGNVRLLVQLVHHHIFFLYNPLLP